MSETERPPEIRMLLLAQTFPALWNTPGINPWNALVVDEWASSGSATHGELCAARFVLAVWDVNQDWRCGQFDLMNALRIWDEWHRKAFLELAANPWWPKPSQPT